MKNTSPHLRVESYLNWWREAGINSVTSDGRYGWLENDAYPPLVVSGNITEKAIFAPQSAELIHDSSPQRKPLAVEDWPTHLADLCQAITQGVHLPGNGYARLHATPVGQTGANVMVIGDVPNEEEVAAGEMGHGADAQLLCAMLRAIGHSLQDCFITALASSRPATGVIPDADMQLLHQWLHHQIAMVGPKQIFTLGSTATKALFSADAVQKEKHQLFINHDGGNTAVTEIIHPRILLMRPALKAHAWANMQQINS